MFITKIEIQNFKCFKEKIILDLDPNKNEIELDVASGYFIKRNEKNDFISPVFSLGGANAKGKTTIIEAMQLFSDFFLGNYINMFLQEFFVTKQIHPVEQVKLINPLKQIIMNKRYKKDVWDPIGAEIIQQVKQEFKIWNVHLYNAFSNNNEKEVKIKILFNNNELEINHFFIEIIFNQSGFVKKILNEEEEEIIDENKIKDIEELVSNFVHNWVFMLNENQFQYLISESFFFPLWTMLFELVEYHGEDKFERILRISDPEIDKIFFLKNQDNKIIGISKIVLTNGSIINENFLSTGTKKFIKLLFYITKLIQKLNEKNSGALLIIDEIDGSFHPGLVNFFKRYIYKIANDFDIQLFFTSHNPYTLSAFLSHKQIFLIEDDKYEKKRIITKVSTNIRKNNSFPKQYLEQKIGSHPSDGEINELLNEI